MKWATVVESVQPESEFNQSEDPSKAFKVFPFVRSDFLFYLDVL